MHNNIISILSNNNNSDSNRGTATNISTKPNYPRGRISERCQNVIMPQPSDNRYHSHIRPSSRYSLGLLSSSTISSLHCIHEQEHTSSVAVVNEKKKPLSTGRLTSQTIRSSQQIGYCSSTSSLVTAEGASAAVAAATRGSTKISRPLPPPAPQSLSSSSIPTTVFCSPPKLVRVINQHPHHDDHELESPFLKLLHRKKILQQSSFHEQEDSLITYEDEATTDDEDEAADSWIDDIENQPANTSLGINTAMTGLALAGCCSSSAESNSQSNSNNSSHQKNTDGNNDNVNADSTNKTDNCCDNCSRPVVIMTTSLPSGTDSAPVAISTDDASSGQRIPKNNVTVQLTASSSGNYFV
ncbi:unnamed protein product [Trichobilharzia szidati]|nr:unnamed protein product [Trichobilharzia szidati]